MFIDKDSIKINNVSMGKYLLEATFQYNKMWSEDSGRNLKGTMSGTLLGIFPKFQLQFRRLSREELEILAPIFDSSSQNFTYYDPVKKRSITISTYSGDWQIKNDYILSNQGFSVSFIAKSRRS